MNTKDSDKEFTFSIEGKDYTISEKKNSPKKSKKQTIHVPSLTIGSIISGICIAVIDESNNGDNAPSIAEYNTFRETFPNRKHFLLQPVSSGAANTSVLMVSALESIYVSGFGTDTSLNGNEIKVHPVNRDQGSADNASDWFDIVGIQTGTITKLALFVDISGSMTLATVAASYAKFIGTCTDAGITVRQESNQVEDWLEPFSGILA